MPVEDSDFISELNPAWPLGTDGVNTSDDHHRNTKKAVLASFPNISGEVTADQDDLNTLTGAASGASPLVPLAAMLPYFGTVAPNGYLMCDGAIVPVEHVDLIAIIGANTPDLRGQFLRGWSVDVTVDPDGPRVPGDVQEDTFESHTHTLDAATDFQGSGSRGGRTASANQGFINPISSEGGAETRPKNVAMGFIIKW